MYVVNVNRNENICIKLIASAYNDLPIVRAPICNNVPSQKREKKITK
jgi:hypothetical protein